MAEIDPGRLYTDVEAAAVFNLKTRSLRTEREAGRIGYKRVAGKIMYRGSDLIEWFNQGEAPCRDETRDRGSPSATTGTYTTSSGPRPDEASDLRRAREISSALKKRSRDSSTGAERTGQVQPILAATRP